jgi:hypothetical protein
MDAYYPRFLELVHYTPRSHTDEEKEYLKKYLEMFGYQNGVSFMDDPERVQEFGILSPNIEDKLYAFYNRLKEEDIEFIIVGAGGGGANAFTVFNLLNTEPVIMDYDRLMVHNLPRIPTKRRQVRFKASAYVNGKREKFNPNTLNRTLIYSGVDFHDRDIVRRNPNIISIDVGFTDDKTFLYLNPQNVGVFAHDTYGKINLHTLFVNAYKGVELFLDWFLAKEDIEQLFTLSEPIAEYSMLDDPNISLYKEKLRVTPFIPNHQRKGNKVTSIPDYIYESNAIEITNSLTNTYKSDWAEFIPIYGLEQKCDIAPISNQRTQYPNLLDSENLKDTEMFEGTIKDAIAVAEERFRNEPRRFMGIIMSYTNEVRVNILHPMTVYKLKTLDREKIFKFWIYTYSEDMPTVPDPTPEKEYRRIYNEVIELIEDSTNITVEPDASVDYDIKTGDILVYEQYAPEYYIQGIDIFNVQNMESIPYYGILVGSMSNNPIRYLTASQTGNISSSGSSVCTGDAHSQLYTSRYRNSKINPTSIYFDKYVPRDMLHEYQYAINYGLDMWALYFSKEEKNV